MRRRKSIEKSAKLHDRIVEKIFEKPKELPIEINGEIIKKLKFPKSVIDKREFADIIFVTLKEKTLNIYFIELKTGLLWGGKARHQIKTATNLFIKEFEQLKTLWKKKLGIENLEIEKITVHSILVWFDKTEIFPKLKIESSKKIIIN
jgi:hypothetical protein